MPPIVDAVFVVNLKRRPDRKRAMQAQLGAMELNCPVHFTEAVDGRVIDAQFMEKCGARLGRWKLDNARSNEEVDWDAFPPWDVRCFVSRIANERCTLPQVTWWRQSYDRELKNGEIGCSLSHLAIWRRVVEENLSAVLVLEVKCPTPYHACKKRTVRAKSSL